VLTGPDHLSALATLSANVGSCPQAFVLGARWGIGHSTGLLLVGVILIVLTRNSKDETIEVPDRATTIFESLVGVFMILLGAWGVRRALVKRSKIYDVEGVVAVQPETSNENSSYSLEFARREENLHVSSAFRDPEQGSSFDETQPIEPVLDDEDETNNIQTTPTSPQENCCKRLFSNVSARTLAFCAGIIHGLAGPGGILGVSFLLRSRVKMMEGNTNESPRFCLHLCRFSQRCSYMMAG